MHPTSAAAELDSGDSIRRRRIWGVRKVGVRVDGNPDAPVGLVSNAQRVIRVAPPFMG